MTFDTFGNVLNIGADVPTCPNAPTKISGVVIAYIWRLLLATVLNVQFKAKMGDNDSLSSSSSSDDEFLTMKSGQSGSDREAMVRRKLLESFYGATIPEQDNDDSPSSEQSNDDPDQKIAATKDYEDQDEDDQSDEVSKNQLEDLDSPYFAADAFAEQHVLRSDMHTLLETEERLSLQVRTLDSTMQTLVYENYSKFISATDAIRSIGVSVNAKEDGMQSLSEGMKVIDEQTRQVEDELGSLRDAVAEKVRIKRLLSRLDSLLKLPETLREDIANGNYRKATKSYLSAHSILSKHSVGFESLKTIETECHGILEDMVKTLRRKLKHWSHSSLLMDSDEGMADEDEEWDQPPDPPKTMSEIFECAGTLFLVLPQDDGDTRTTFDSGFSADECKSMSLVAAVRLLERLLDAHQIELQDAMFSSSDFDEDTYGAKLNHNPQETDDQAPPKGSNLIPTVYLDNILEAAALFGLSFGCGSISKLGEEDRQNLIDFLSEAYSGFLAHVRAVLLEQSLQVEPPEESENAVLDETAEEGDKAYGEVSGAMSFLLKSVRDLASGLALPEIGVDVEFAAGLFDQAVEVTEAMVRRRVAETFFILRQHVVQDCLSPFVKEAIAYPSDEDARVVAIVQMASVALSDGMQLVDDTVRSILTGEEMVSSTKGVQIEMIKDAVQACSRRFATWLASTLERLAGCESSEPKKLIEVRDKIEEVEDDIDGLNDDAETSQLQKTDDMSNISDLHDTLADKVESALDDIFGQIDEASDDVVSELILAISEMCRLAERSIMENIQNSITSSMEGDRKAHKSSHMFSLSEEPSARRVIDKEKGISDRFHLAASRVLTMYALNHGSTAGMAACKDLYEIAGGDGEPVPTRPRSGVCTLLEHVKMASIECSFVFGGKKRANPVPEFPDDEDDFYPRSPMLRSGKSLAARMPTIKGLQLDVERMFSEKVPTYPNPSKVLDFTREAVVAIIMKVAFKAIEEQARTCTFGASGYRQLQVDVAFLRHMIPHYISDEYVFEGTNANIMVGNILSDVMAAAGERCVDEDCIGSEQFNDTEGNRKTPLDVVRFFMSSADAADKESKLFIIYEDITE
jgi:hypothetical protein